jgi:hypothetical protein
MDIRVTLDGIKWKTPRAPLDYLLANPSAELIKYEETLGKAIKAEIKTDIKNTSGSSRGRTSAEIKFSAGYYASLLTVYVSKNPRKRTGIYITSRGTNARRYEDVHGHLVKGIARRKQT